MRIAYLARHDSGGNDDEGAISFALESLGHEVTRIPESKQRWIRKANADFVLCHHLHDWSGFSKDIPLVFWCFDLIEWPGMQRHVQRRAWIEQLTERAFMGFCTDGDWVAKDQTGKLHWLTQGADTREVEPLTKDNPNPPDILFIGGIGYGRDKFVQELRERYGEKFKHILKGCHGSAFAWEVRNAKIVVAPPTPVTDRYFSNRVYNVLKAGGFLLHPWSKGIYKQFDAPLALMLYQDTTQLHDWINLSLMGANVRAHWAAVGQQRVLNYHTYRHRCTELVRIVQEEL